LRSGEAAEFGAFALVTAVVWHFADFWWALIPVAVYLFVLSLALDGGKR
jgi:hypothetical protein